MRKLTLLAGLLALAVMTPAMAWAAEAPACPASCIIEYPVPVPVVSNGPSSIAQCPSDMCSSDQDIIVRIGSYGNFTLYAFPSARADVGSVARGSDGNTWFTERGTGRVGSIDGAGRFTENSIPTANSLPQAVLQDPDGIVWFTDLVGNKVGRSTTGGQLTEYPLAPGSRPAGIAVGSGDPAVWVADFGSTTVARIALDGAVTGEYPTPSPAATPFQMAAGPDR